MKKSIIAQIIVEGVHCWSNCTLDEVIYLKDLHRHQFNITASAKVDHANRDIEFIQLGHKIKDHLHKRFWHEKLKLLHFGSMSCEMICEEILAHFKELSFVEVWEDRENGARVER